MGYDKKKVLETIAKLLKDNEQYVDSHNQSAVTSGLWLTTSARARHSTPCRLPKNC